MLKVFRSVFVDMTPGCAALEEPPAERPGQHSGTAAAPGEPGGASGGECSVGVRVVDPERQRSRLRPRGVPIDAGLGIDRPPVSMEPPAELLRGRLDRAGLVPAPRDLLRGPRRPSEGNSIHGGRLRAGGRRSPPAAAAAHAWGRCTSPAAVAFPGQNQKGSTLILLSSLLFVEGAVKLILSVQFLCFKVSFISVRE